MRYIKSRGSEVSRAGVRQSLFQVTGIISEACEREGLDIHGLASKNGQLLTRRVHHSVDDDERVVKDQMNEIGRYPHAIVP